MIHTLDEATTFATASSIFGSRETNLQEAMGESEEFTQKFFGKSVSLKKSFLFPVELPFRQCLVIYDPGLPVDDLVNKALLGQDIRSLRKPDHLMRVKSQASLARPRVCVVERSLTPLTSTMGKPSEYLGKPTERFMNARDYIVAFGLNFHFRKTYWDMDTWTVFSDHIFPEGRMGYGTWFRAAERFGLGTAYPEACSHGRYGARLRITVPSKK
ncbi:MAG: hypothetical protein V4481_04035 [Patescibacteria group bacterium]